MFPVSLKLLPLPVSLKLLPPARDRQKDISIRAEVSSKRTSVSSTTKTGTRGAASTSKPLTPSCSSKTADTSQDLDECSVFVFFYPSFARQSATRNQSSEISQDI